jgi:ABC-type antimicrobial peptide transport system permease subunit
MALGADAARVTRSVMKQGFSLAAVGMIFGFPAALALSSLYRAFLYEVTPTDPRTFLAAAAVLLLIAVVASLGPARRAAKVEPMTAVRHE